MKWFRKSLGGAPAQAPDESLRDLRNKFTSFYTVLDRNNRALGLMSELEERASGSCPVNTAEVRVSLRSMNAAIEDMLKNMIILGGASYEPLLERFHDIGAVIGKLLPGNSPGMEDELAIPFSNIRRDRAWSVGGKNAHPGEIRGELGIPVPDGFAVSAWAYHRFLEAGGLQGRINDFIGGVNINSFEDLIHAAEEIQKMILDNPVPEDLEAAILDAFDALVARTGVATAAVRSSAIGEDSYYSFAGQYATFLNVTRDRLLERYRKVLASKFSARSIYYFLSHALSESQLAMSVCVMSMVDAASSGAVYTWDPVRPQSGCLVAHAVSGLGQSLMVGEVSPDVFHINRDSGEIQLAVIADKPYRTVVRDGRLITESLTKAERSARCVSEDTMRTLAQYALKIEKHFGCPQDIEWAADHEGGVYVLQTRPLRIVEDPQHNIADVSGLELAASGGGTVCPGAGGGPVFHAMSRGDITRIPDGAVVVAARPFPALVTVMNKMAALLIAESGLASHTATLAREHMIPTIAGIAAAQSLPQGSEVTVDGTDCCVYHGIAKSLIRARRARCSFRYDSVTRDLLNDILAYVTPLNLIHTDTPDFTIGNCRTLHDVTRYAHQKAMDEMFAGAQELESRDHFSLSLISNIPLEINIIYIDQDLSAYPDRCIREEEIASAPMRAFWEGLRSEPWPGMARRESFHDMNQPLAVQRPETRSGKFSQRSFAVLSEEYMMLSLRLGYHFSTVEALCSGDPARNYVRMQLKQGGASRERRVRRVRLMADILEAMGFDNYGHGDFLDAEIQHLSAEPVRERLHGIGRLTVLTKQLDMALSSDALSRWYTEDIAKKLGIDPAALPEAPAASGSPDEDDFF
jgi:pyruvate,water dikinase